MQCSGLQGDWLVTIQGRRYHQAPNNTDAFLSLLACTFTSSHYCLQNPSLQLDSESTRKIKSLEKFFETAVLEESSRTTGRAPDTARIPQSVCRVALAFTFTET